MVGLVENTVGKQQSIRLVILFVARCHSACSVNTVNVANGATSGRLLSPINEESQPAYDNKVSLEARSAGTRICQLGNKSTNEEGRSKRGGRDRWRPPNSKELEKLTFRLRAETSKREIYPTRPR